VDGNGWKHCPANAVTPFATIVALTQRIPCDGRFVNVATPVELVVCVVMTPVGTLLFEIPVDNVTTVLGTVAPVPDSSVMTVELGLLGVDEPPPLLQPASIAANARIPIRVFMAARDLST
jgi:hypothetical protein